MPTVMESNCSIAKGSDCLRIPKIYLETTMFNYYIDTDRDAHADTVILFEDCAAGKFKPFTSTYTTNELEAAPPIKRDKMFSLIKRYGVEVLEATETSDALALRYIAEGALPKGSLMDASHIAIASINELDIIVSLNFSHIVRSKTIEMTAAINVLVGLGKIKIESPMGVIDSEKVRYNRN
jgi:predicted nucleic acid-binding protein